MDLLIEYHIVHSYLGFIHLIAAILAMIFGSVVFIMKKGTDRHRAFGYCYVASMLLMNGTAFGIYNFGSISLFHGFALLSLASLFFGMRPALQRKEGWLEKHFYFMSWSVVGLYCAFWAEVGVRLFDMQYFWWVVMLATIGTSVIGSIYINREAKQRRIA